MNDFSFVGIYKYIYILHPSNRSYISISVESGWNYLSEEDPVNWFVIISIKLTYT